jgi:hypothetical protein
VKPDGLVVDYEGELVCVALMVARSLVGQELANLRAAEERLIVVQQAGEGTASADEPSREHVVEEGLVEEAVAIAFADKDVSRGHRLGVPLPFIDQLARCAQYLARAHVIDERTENAGPCRVTAECVANRAALVGPEVLEELPLRVEVQVRLGAGVRDLGEQREM